MDLAKRTAEERLISNRIRGQPNLGLQRRLTATDLPGHSFALLNSHRLQGSLRRCVELWSQRDAVGRPAFAKVVDCLQSEFCEQIQTVQNRE